MATHREALILKLLRNIARTRARHLNPCFGKERASREHYSVSVTNDDLVKGVWTYCTRYTEWHGWGQVTPVASIGEGLCSTLDRPLLEAAMNRQLLPKCRTV